MSNNKMRVEIKQMWLDALRSGEYKQGKHVLHSGYDNSFCCLGVLCDLHKKHSINKLNWILLTINYDFEYDGKLDTLPEIVINWAGLDNNKKLILDKLINYNDRGYTFLEISEIIEAEL